ncbi:MAG: lactonase family protein [Bryobacterales bacterium]|nr:lactonase family protein [Bryobacterales bacterium]
MNGLKHFFIATLLSAPALWAAGPEYLVYIGTSGRNSKGIYVSRFDAGSGKMTEPQLAAEAVNPNFLALHPNRRFLYAVGGSGKEGSVMAFKIDAATGQLAPINSVSARGAGPCHISLDRTAKNALIANYGSGSVAVVPIREDGGLEEATAFIQHTGSSVNPQRQKEPHAHSINLSPDNRFAMAADLGTDQILIYRFNAAKGTLVPNDPPFAKVKPGSGPRHFAFHTSGRFAYAINEMGNTVTAFSYDARRGALTEIQDITTLPEGFSGTSYCAEVVVHPRGRFLYGSNRGHDSIAVFSIDPGRGTLTPIEQVSTQGKFPRNFNLDPSGSWLLAANQDTHNIAVYRVDRKTGRLKATGDQVKAPTPICIRFLRLK